MFIKYLMLVFLMTVLRIHITSQAHNLPHKPNRGPQGSLNVPSSAKGKKRIFFLDVNHINRRHQPDSEPRIPLRTRSWPKTPSLYLEPPRILKNRRKNLKNATKKIQITTNSQENRPTYVRDHDPDPQSQHKESLNVKENNSEEKSEENAIQFHVHGHQGPDSYVFGYDTGKGNNRQFRLEERHENGTVTGHYGYYDRRGKLRKIFYSAKPSTGYEETQVNTNSHSAGQ